MTPEEVVEHYPRLYHMAEDGSWDSIRSCGLLSTRALLDLFEADIETRRRLLSERRPQSVTLAHPVHGSAVVRDQKPLNPTILARCLDGMVPQEWYETLNKRVFFWLSEERLCRLLEARAYRGRAHDVLTVDTASLLEAHLDRVTLAHINTGTAIFKAPTRGVGTFLRVEDYPFDAWRRRRGVQEAVVELAVDGSVRDIASHALRVESRQGGTILATRWQR